MSNDSPVLTSLTENSTDVPVSAGQGDSYVLLLVVLSVFAGGTVVLVSLLLLFCHRCCMGGRRYSRASDDPEKTNTTYAEDSLPTQEITIRLDESDALSASSCHDGDSDRFVSMASTARRVSFNESALYEQEKATQDKGRRYTLTEGDFHHLKKARLTHLHLPPAPCDLKILTIMECDSNESSTVNINEPPSSKLPLSIYQLTERRVFADPLDWVGGLPGDPHHSVIIDQGRQSSLVRRPHHTRSQTMETIADRGEPESKRGGNSHHALGQTSVLSFLSKLRRHASLEGAGPYFRRWKFDTSHRAASLDDKGSPKRRPFQRQRAASETTDQTEDDSSLRDDTIDSIPQSPIETSALQSLSAECLSHVATAPTTSVFYSRLKLEAMCEVGVSDNTSRENPCLLTHEPPVSRQDKAKKEEETKIEKAICTESANTTHKSVEDDNLFEPQQEKEVQVTFDEMYTTVTNEQEISKQDDTEVVDGEDVVLGAVARQRADSGSLMRQESTEAPPSLYRDIWSLRASLEQYASSDQSSTDRESIRSDADSVSSFGGPGARAGLDTCLSQDLDDEPDGEGDVEVVDGGPRSNGETGSVAMGDGESGNRKLLQMDSGYASIEAPSRAPEDMRIFGLSGAARGKTASERRLFFTNSGRKGSVCESVEAKLLQEELEDELMDSNEKLQNSHTANQSVVLQDPLMKSTHLQAPESHLMSTVIKPIVPQPSSPHRPRLRRRDYSIDEKTDALFNEFLRHDPRFDQQDSPLRTRRRSRVHLRKQWQRHKQYSDPGSSAGGRYSPSLERQRFTPLKRGDSAGYPLDTRYHSTLSRIASAADEEASEVAASEEAANQSEDNKCTVVEGDPGDVNTSPKDPEITKDNDGTCEGEACPASTDTESTTSSALATVNEPTSHINPRVDNRNNNSSQAMLSEALLQPESSLTDKLVSSVEERLYGSLRSKEKHNQRGTEGTVTMYRTASPGYKPK